MDVLTINGVVVPTPKSGAWDDTSVSSSESGRDDAANMQNDIRALKVSLPYEWPCLTATQTATLLQAVYMNGLGNINVTVHNPLLNQMKTYNCYASDRHVPMAFVKNNVPHYEGITITFIEN